MAEEGRRQVEIERQKREVEHLEYLRQEAIRKRIKAEKESLEELLVIINAWAKAKKIDDFFSDAERRVADLSDENKKVILERIQQARDMIGGSDALQRFGEWKSPEEILRSIPKYY